VPKQKGSFEHISFTLDGNLTLFHCLEQSRLVLGGVRLISSASRIFVKIGPRISSNVESFCRHTRVPTMSAGNRSGVN